MKEKAAYSKLWGLWLLTGMAKKLRAKKYLDLPRNRFDNLQVDEPTYLLSMNQVLRNTAS